MFTDTKEYVAARSIIAGEVTLLLEVVLGGAVEIGRAADQERKSGS